MSLSFITEEEVPEAIKIVTEHLGFEPPKVVGKFLAVKLFVREEDIVTHIDDTGKEYKVAIPPVVSEADPYRSSVALVIAVGNDCYKGERYKKSGPWCRVGDWIFIPRNEGQQKLYRGVALQYILEDKIYCVIEDPSHISISTMNY